MAARPEPRRGWLAAAAALALALAACEAPAAPFAQEPHPPAPDYDRRESWLAFPGRPGPERLTPAGFMAVDEAAAPADVFFIHPTTYLKNDVWNAAIGAERPLTVPVLMNQVSVFNGCCRLFAPSYRQTSVKGLSNPEAVDLAYQDVARAFRWYIAHENHGRPFIIASHSQGTFHAIRLLQAEVMGTPLQDRLVAAYAVGAYVPADFPKIGLPVCDSPRQTGCIVSWNASETGRDGARMLIEKKTVWWQGRVIPQGGMKALCVDPLSWTIAGASPAAANPGSVPWPEKPYEGRPMPASTPGVTGAVCKDGLLKVTVADKGAAKAFHDPVSFLTGSYHGTDYGLFYASLRANAGERVAAWKDTHDGH